MKLNLLKIDTIIEFIDFLLEDTDQDLTEAETAAIVAESPEVNVK
jgi:hypothetical protein